MSDPKEFLSRWSRLKHEAEQAEPDASGQAIDPAPPPDPPPPVPELPPIEILTAASDFKPFLQAGVPESLKLAALRRLWSIDPEIRDFVGPARDYGWDWNTPGGVPGSGALPSAEEIARAVERILGVEESTEAAPEAAKTKGFNSLPQAWQDRPEPPKARLPESQSVPQDVGAAEKSGQKIQAEPTVKRRHGSATPE